MSEALSYEAPTDPRLGHLCDLNFPRSFHKDGTEHSRRYVSPHLSVLCVTDSPTVLPKTHSMPPSSILFTLSSHAAVSCPLYAACFQNAPVDPRLGRLCVLNFRRSFS